ncbi:MAG: SMC-Scp complex subunit ScpB [Deltaproteobacteria bacterium]|nr:SMC-Scp complex subunit ScpB [Deltaproteobacteria bacterium]
MPELKYILESLLFVSPQPLGMDRLKKALPEEEPLAIREALAALDAEYEARGGGFFLCEVAGGWQLRTRPRYALWVRRLSQSQPVRLSPAALETLAIVAYNQPVLRSCVEHVRGVDSGGVLKVLLEKGLIRVPGRDDKPGRPMLYATTKKFLEVFELKDLADLPSLSQIKDLARTNVTAEPLGEGGQADGASDETDGPQKQETPEKNN